MTHFEEKNGKDIKNIVQSVADTLQQCGISRRTILSNISLTYLCDQLFSVYIYSSLEITISNMSCIEYVI